MDASPPKDLSSPLPPWYPDWARRLAELYFSGTTCLFLLHGNIHDLVRCSEPDEATRRGRYCNVSEFLANQMFGSWDLVVAYDLGRGLRPMAGGDADRLRDMVAALGPVWGEPSAWPREPEKAMLWLGNLMQRNLVADSPSRKSIGVVLPYAQYLAPSGDVGALARNEASRLVQLLSWAQNPYIKRVNTAICLLVEKLSELNDRLVQNPHVAEVEIPLPSDDQRLGFVRSRLGAGEPAAEHELTAEEIARSSAGLSLVNLDVIVSQSRTASNPMDSSRFGKIKKSMIQRECGNLVEFIEPDYTLDLVVGHEAAKKRLKDDAARVVAGQLDVAPMGYLLCGPVGTGKSFVAQCYAGSIGIPCVKLRNFRSKYVGETEGNLQRIFNVLRSLGPVVVIIDEADAMLGNRDAGGDSGTSGRVFSMVASQMGDTSYRGKIIWMLLTCRPDLLPVDLKRQGRAEVHIPLFYPQDQDELVLMFQVMARKNGIEISANAAPPITDGMALSGADIESVILAARRAALDCGRDQVDSDDLQQAMDRFIPSSEGLEKEMQEIAAVLECTDTAFLPAAWRDRVQGDGGRTQLQQQLMSLRELVG